MKLNIKNYCFVTGLLNCHSETFIIELTKNVHLQSLVYFKFYDFGINLNKLNTCVSKLLQKTYFETPRELKAE